MHGRMSSPAQPTFSVSDERESDWEAKRTFSLQKALSYLPPVPETCWRPSPASGSPVGAADGVCEKEAERTRRGHRAKRGRGGEGREEENGTSWCPLPMTRSPTLVPEEFWKRSSYQLACIDTHTGQIDRRSAPQTERDRARPSEGERQRGSEAPRVTWRCTCSPSGHCASSAPSQPLSVSREQVSLGVWVGSSCASPPPLSPVPRPPSLPHLPHRPLHSRPQRAASAGRLNSRSHSRSSSTTTTIISTTTTSSSSSTSRSSSSTIGSSSTTISSPTISSTTSSSSSSSSRSRWFLPLTQQPSQFAPLSSSLHPQSILHNHIQIQYKSSPPPSLNSGWCLACLVSVWLNDGKRR